MKYVQFLAEQGQARVLDKEGVHRGGGARGSVAGREAPSDFAPHRVQDARGSLVAIALRAVSHSIVRVAVARRRWRWAMRISQCSCAR
jgi:hypothetical protein